MSARAAHDGLGHDNPGILKSEPEHNPIARAQAVGQANKHDVRAPNPKRQCARFAGGKTVPQRPHLHDPVNDAHVVEIGPRRAIAGDPEQAIAACVADAYISGGFARARRRRHDPGALNDRRRVLRRGGDHNENSKDQS
jgi:hypothetical protein